MITSSAASSFTPNGFFSDFLPPPDVSLSSSPPLVAHALNSPAPGPTSRATPAARRSSSRRLSRDGWVDSGMCSPRLRVVDTLIGGGASSAKRVVPRSRSRAYLCACGAGQVVIQGSSSQGVRSSEAAIGTHLLDSLSGARAACPVGLTLVGPVARDGPSRDLERGVGALVGALRDGDVDEVEHHQLRVPGGQCVRAER